MIILGLDPGSRTLGFGVVGVDERDALYAITYGHIDTGKDTSHSGRLAVIHQDLGQLLRRYRPDVAAVERLVFGSNITTCMAVAEARGVILLELQLAGVAAVTYTPMQVKLAVAGTGKAKKSQVQQAVKERLQLEAIPKPDDAADGLALAITHADALAAYHRAVGSARE